MRIVSATSVPLGYPAGANANPARSAYQESRLRSATDPFGRNSPREGNLRSGDASLS